MLQSQDPKADEFFDGILEIFSDHLTQRKKMFLSEVVYLIAGIQIQLMDTSLQPLQHSSAHKASLSQGLSTTSVELGCMLIAQHGDNLSD